MKLIFVGADHEVTGSCHYISVNGKNILVDYGMEQGKNYFENVPLPVPASDIDFVLVTHAHIDHTGMLPKLYSEGFRGEIHCTRATNQLSEIMLKDSAHIQESEYEWKTRKGKRSGEPVAPPLYDIDDALGALSCFVSHPYESRFELTDGVEVNFVDAGHLLGSSSIELWLTENGKTKKIVFSGDIGNDNQPLIKDPTFIKSADYVVMESTYGDRNHGERDNYEEKLLSIMLETFNRGGNLVVPCFAVGRTQEMLYFIRKIKESGKLGKFQNIPVYVDSPMAVEATHVFHASIEECFDAEAKELVCRGINPISFQGLKLAVGLEDSKKINEDPNPKVILSASGMCDAGRVRHHLKHNLWRRDSTILFAGYQAAGTLGRALQDGAETVKLFGEEIQVEAKLEKISGISGHADRDGLLKWIGSFEKKPNQIFVVHGEDSVCSVFASDVQKQENVRTDAPYSGSIYDLIEGRWIKLTEPVPYVKQTKVVSAKLAAFERLLAAGQRLLSIIRKNEGLSNKDKAKFADQINSLCDKWE